MAASKEPNLASYPFGAASRPQKGGLDSFGFFEAAFLYIFWELLRRDLQTSDTQLKCTPWFSVAQLIMATTEKEGRPQKEKNTEKTYI